MRVSTRSPMPGATFWVLAISALALIAFVSGPVAEEHPLAVGGILAFMFVQAALPACRHQRQLGRMPQRGTPPMLTGTNRTIRSTNEQRDPL